MDMEMFVDGRWVPASGGARQSVVNPATGAVIDTVPAGNANDSRYGLAGFVFSRDLTAALTLAERLEAGSIWINNIHRSSHHAPFGGVKDSGIGREKGRYGVEAYLEYKTTYVTYDAALS